MEICSCLGQITSHAWSGVPVSKQVFGGEHRTEPVPPISHRFAADTDTLFVKETLHVAERERGKRMYNIRASLMNSVLVLNHLKGPGLVMHRRHRPPCPAQAKLF